MTPDDWKKIRYFTPAEKWGDPQKMDFNLIYNLDRLRRYLKRPIIIHCGYETREKGGYHPQGKAVDCHIEGLHVIEMYAAASRFRFGGIGVYPWWNNPGLHLDTRPVPKGESRAIWGSLSKGIYVAFDTDFLRFCLDMVKTYA